MVFYYTRNFLKISELNFVSMSHVSPTDHAWDSNYTVYISWEYTQ
jgi:hypothetical protein